ncbi:hydroxymyristoyl-ACP dehydratase [Pseudomonas sp. gcc21]|uniref:hydroxymyristoyl-ACP dehydratase n=1 Tax=Pseudomonas sp. gcc21 TaxID=2726989 RepID=UPI001451CAB0|nr:hydroxymyristoyl-ACP dehydratase [Pseudomonas sp. gcc21]QJD60358.1 hydroxymyristoyl-ACP dehydratase [Pseudomonas sp. gcc21]
MHTHRSPAPMPPIADLLPHNAPMVLVDSIIRWDEQSIHCQSRSHLQRDNPLRDAGMLSVFAGVEYAAQAMAAHARLLLSDTTDARPRKGFIAVASKLAAHVDTLDSIAGSLHIEARMLAHNADSSLYAFTLSTGDQTLLTGQLTAVTISDEGADL